MDILILAGSFFSVVETNRIIMKGCVMFGGRVGIYQEIAGDGDFVHGSRVAEEGELQQWGDVTRQGGTIDYPPPFMLFLVGIAPVNATS